MIGLPCRMACAHGLLKAGKPCFVPEAPEAYPELSELRGMFLHLGSIPTYPVLGNPITPGEESIANLADELAARGIYAIELIPSRNTAERVAEVLEVCRQREWPVFDGTEHNTAKMEPLLTEWGSDPRFRQQFKDGACVLLGHQALVAKGEAGYVDRDGNRTEDGYQRCLAAGREMLGSINNRAVHLLCTIGSTEFILLPYNGLFSPAD